MLSAAVFKISIVASSLKTPITLARWVALQIYINTLDDAVRTLVIVYTWVCI